MKASFLTATLFICCLTSTAFAQQAKLEGHVYTHMNAPVSGVRIVAPGGQAAVTSTKGRFLISFAAPVQPGQATRIEVARAGWVIYEPMLGNCVTQSIGRNYQPLKVIIVPKGSPLALSPKRLSQVIARWSDERNKLRGQVGKLRSQFDEYTFLREYAEKYGFTLDQFISVAEQWAKSAESKDKYEQALKEYFLKNYSRAAELAHESAMSADEELERTNNQRKEVSLKVIDRFKLEGNALYDQSKYREALASYTEIDKRFTARKISKDDLIEKWAEVKLLLGNAKSQLGIRVEGEESKVLLSESVQEYQQAMSVYTREALSRSWAKVQINLGNALGAQGERLSGEDRVRLLAEAVKAYQQALDVCTREGLSLEGAAAQNNLGIALGAQGEQVVGEESVKLFRQAVEAYRQALSVYTRETLPQDWAMTQNNLGIALGALGERLSGEEGMRLLREAVEAYRQALIIHTREALPQAWATAQSNLGAALRSQGERVGGEEGLRLLRQAQEALKLALMVRTRETLPRQWARTENNLGNTLYLLEDWPNAANSFVNVLTVYPKYEEAYKKATFMTHEILFNYPAAFRLNQQWLEHNTGELFSEADFTEKHFTTARFTECEQRIAKVLSHPDLEANTKIVLQAVEIANLIVMGKASLAIGRVGSLMETVSKQPADFQVKRPFVGIRHFIGQHEKLASHRAWLDQLFEAIGASNRDAILKSLKEVQAKFKQ